MCPGNLRLSFKYQKHTLRYPFRKFLFTQFFFKQTFGDNYNILVELTEKGKSCRRKLGRENKINFGDDMIIGTSESLFKYYSVDIR